MSGSGESEVKRCESSVADALRCETCVSEVKRSVADAVLRVPCVWFELCHVIVCCVVDGHPAGFPFDLSSPLMVRFGYALYSVVRGWLSGV